MAEPTSRPPLVERGHEVVNVSRGTAAPYRPHPAWKAVEQIVVDRRAEEAEGKFGSRLAGLDADIVIDMISFELEGTQQLVETLHRKIEHYLFCSSIWVYGHAVSVPCTEVDRPNAIDTYGANKAKIVAWLLQQARRNGFPATSFRPGHIVGEGWVPINPLGNFNIGVFSLIARGEELVLPNLGLEMLHHVHADDVAQWIICAIEHRTASIGEIFNTVSSQALTMRGHAEAMYRWFEQEPRLSFAPFDQWKLGLEKSDAETSWGHIMRSSCVSIEKSRQHLGYSPRFSSLEAIQQFVAALIASGRITLPKSEVIKQRAAKQQRAKKLNSALLQTRRETRISPENALFSPIEIFVSAACVLAYLGQVRDARSKPSGQELVLREKRDFALLIRPNYRFADRPGTRRKYFARRER